MEKCLFSISASLPILKQPSSQCILATGKKRPAPAATAPVDSFLLCRAADGYPMAGRANGSDRGENSTDHVAIGVWTPPATFRPIANRKTPRRRAPRQQPRQCKICCSCLFLLSFISLNASATGASENIPNRHRRVQTTR